ncbi:MAG: PQQ-binding-like beta-propeller repeat protein [Spirochaetes bacterium]|nr:PQQ-binding-like beta-propeller repeat protein [Spirochaetota bacterium]
MKSLSSDALMVGVSALIISACSFFLYLDFTAKIEVGDAEQIGIITYKKRLSQRKYGTQVIWEEIEQNSPVFVNDSLRTAERSEAVVKLNDGTTIELDENSMIVLAKMEGAININFAQGSMMARRSGVVTEDMPAVNIVAGGTTVSVEKSDVKLAQTEKEDIALTVAKGTAIIKAGEEEKLITVNQSAVLVPDEKKVQVKNVTLRLLTPEHNKYFITRANWHVIPFEWDVEGENRVIFFELSADRLFSTIIKRINVKDRVINEKLPSGEYFWRISAEDKTTKAIDYSEVRKFSVLKEQPVMLFAPHEGEKYSFVGDSPFIRFRWSKNDLASNYVLEIAQDDAFKNKMIVSTTTLTEHTVNSLTSGLYFWRVISKFDPIPEYAAASEVRKFVIEKRKIVPPTELIHPAAYAVFSDLEVKNRGILLSWKQIEGIALYELLISKTEDFSKVELKREVRGNFAHIVQSFLPGKYFWKVRPLIGEEAEGVTYTIPRSFTVQEGTISLISPVHNIVLEATQEASEILFSWNKVPFEGKYRFELSKKPSFDKVERKELIEIPSLKVSVVPGKYYWRVALVDNTDVELCKSDVRSFVVRESEPVSTKATLAIEPFPSSAIVFINGKKAGKGKVEISIEPGSVAIEVIAEGYKKFEKTVEIASGEKKEIVANLERLLQKSFLALRVVPSRSAVYVNDKFVGYGEAKLEVDPGAINLVVQSPGYKKYERKLFLKEGERKELAIELELIQKEVPLSERKEQIATSPLLVGNAIVTATPSGIIAASDKGGTSLWQVKLPSKVESTPVADEKTVYVATTKGELLALDSTTGKLRWRKDIDGPVLFSAKPLRVEDKIVVATSFGSIEAFTNKGELLWKRKLESGVFSSPAYYRGVIYVGAADRGVYALSSKSGEILWKYIADSRMVVSSPVVDRELVFVGCYSGSFYALAAKDGKLKWKYKAPSPIVTTPVVWDDKIAIASMNGEIAAFYVENGKAIWKFDTKSRIVLDPVYRNGEMYVASHKTFYSIDATKGSVKWRLDLENTIKTAPSIIGEDVVMSLVDGTLVSLNPSQRKRN